MFSYFKFFISKPFKWVSIFISDIRSGLLNTFKKKFVSQLRPLPFKTSISERFIVSIEDSLEAHTAARTLQKKLYPIFLLKKAKIQVNDGKRQDKNHLDNVQKLLNSIPVTQNITLLSTPKQPNPAPKLTEQEIIHFVNNLPESNSQDKELLKDFLKQAQYISINKFYLNLKISLAQFISYLTLHHIEDYEVLLTPCTSTQWVFESATRYLSILPSKICISNSKTIPDCTSSFSEGKPIVIFDDWSITANQLSILVLLIHRRFPNKKIILVVPYMTIGALNHLKNEDLKICFQEDKLVICTSGILNTLHIMKHFMNVDAKSNQLKANLNLTPNTNLSRKTLVYSDWKTPDIVSNCSRYKDQNLPIPEIYPCYRN